MSGQEPPGRDPTQMVDEAMLLEVDRMASEPPPSMRGTAPPPLPSARRARRKVLVGSVLAALLAIGGAVAIGSLLGPDTPSAGQGASPKPAGEPPPVAGPEPTVVELGAVVVSSHVDGGRDAGAGDAGNR